LIGDIDKNDVAFQDLWKADTRVLRGRPIDRVSSNTRIRHF